jgi:hypothetical protein
MKKSEQIVMLKRLLAQRIAQVDSLTIDYEDMRAKRDALQRKLERR